MSGGVDETVRLPDGVRVPGAGAGVVLPSREDPVARSAGAVLGGPAGRRVRTRRSAVGVAAGVCVALGTVVMVVAVLLRQHCRAALWPSPGQFTHACYSDIPTQFVAGGLGEGFAPYLTRVDGDFLNMPLGSGWLLWVLGQLTPMGAADQPRAVFDLAVLLLVAALAVTVAAVAHLAGRRPWDAALVALSPVLLTSSLIGFELVATALATGGLWASARGRPVLAGLLVGLAATVAPVLALVLLAMVLVAWRRSRDDAGRGAATRARQDVDDDAVAPAPRPVVRTTASAVLVWVVVGLPVLLARPQAWESAVLGRLLGGIGYGSPWLLPDLAGRRLDAHVGAVLAVVGTVAVVVAVAALVLRSARPPRVPVVALLLVVGTLLVGTALPPQAAVLVLPLAALAVPRWRDLLVWGAVEAAVATGTWLYLYGVVPGGEPSRALPPWAYAALLVVRLLTLAWLAGTALLAAREPADDPVRAPTSEPALAEDDPTLPAAQLVPVPVRED